jgi:hypothetical protein
VGGEREDNMECLIEDPKVIQYEVLCTFTPICPTCKGKKEAERYNYVKVFSTYHEAYKYYKATTGTIRLTAILERFEID